MSMDPSISVCIPAYNRASLLRPLLDSIVTQPRLPLEIVVCEDGSPERAGIRLVCEEYARSHPGLISYHENPRNFGYDGNLRRLVEMAKGDFCLFMGNDDLLGENAIEIITSAARRHPEVGLILRSYAAFDDDPKRPSQIFRYFPDERFFPAGPASISTLFRRSVVISGLTLHRRLALEFSTEIFDGSLLYQLYLVARILSRRNGVFVPDIVALYRNGGIPDFGNAESERGKFVPREHTPESSLHFMREMLRIAKHVELTDGVEIYEPILRDISRYSYPVLSIQADKPRGVFLSYMRELHKLGFGSSPLFYLYGAALLTLGAKNTERAIKLIKDRLGYTPTFGDIYKGRPS